MRAAISLLALVVLAGLILVILDVDPEELGEALTEVDRGLLALAAGLYLVNLSIKATRWRVLVRTAGVELPFRQAFRLFICGLAVNNTTPGGVGGEPLRALLLRHETEVPAGGGLATIFSERLMDLTFILALSVTGLWLLLPQLSPEEGGRMVVSLGLLVALLAGLLAFALHPAPLRWLMARLDPAGRVDAEEAEHPVGQGGDEATATGAVGGLKLKLARLVGQFARGLDQLRARPGSAATAMVVTLVIWLTASLRFGVLVLAVTGDVEAAGLIILAAGLTYSVGHFLPFGTGTVAVATLVLTAAGVDSEEAAAIGLFEVLTSLALSVPMGLVAMGVTGKPTRARGVDEGEEAASRD